MTKRKRTKQRTVAFGSDHAADDVGGMIPTRLRKVICCTNIAETSLTIDGVRFVLDTGRAKMLKYDHQLRCASLVDEPVSIASTKQRRGRAGRTATGEARYLFSEEDHRSMAEYDTPQIMMRPVDEMILYAFRVQGCSVEDLGLLNTPAPEDVAAAKQRLVDLGFVSVVSFVPLAAMPRSPAPKDDKGGESGAGLLGMAASGTNAALGIQDPYTDDEDETTSIFKIIVLANTTTNMTLTYSPTNLGQHYWEQPFVGAGNVKNPGGKRVVEGEALRPRMLFSTTPIDLKSQVVVEMDNMNDLLADYQKDSGKQAG